jgi:uncharacterized RDD family membrane protein YckC
MTAGVVTGEAVRLDVRLGHWPSRLIAKIIDSVAQFVLFGLFLVVLGGALSGSSDSALGAALSVSVALLVFVGYNVILETAWRGRTLGKAALGLRVVRDDGGPVRFRHALVRGIMWPLESWGPALFASIFSKRGKRFGDMLAGTIVVQERVPGVTPNPTQMPPALAGWAATLDLSRFGDDLAMSCRQFLGRQRELNPAAREAMGGALVAAVQACVTPAPPAGVPGWAYLSAVLAERRRREEQRMYGAPPAFGGAPAYGPPAYGAPVYGPPAYGPPSPYAAPAPPSPYAAPAPAPPPPPPSPPSSAPKSPTTGPFAPPE